MTKFVPGNLVCDEPIFEISFHPTRNVLAGAMISGIVDLWEYATEEGQQHKRLLQLTHHISSCRGVKFNEEGSMLFSISSDKTWQVIDSSGKVSIKKSNAHNAALNQLCILDNNLIATGDDDGAVKLWDIRTKSQDSVMSWDAHTDFVSDFEFVSEKHSLLSSGGDATLCVYDIRKAAHFYKSDDQESELHALCVLKGGTKVACGLADGVLSLFSWGDWGDCSDRYPGHPESIESLVKVDESTVLTGSVDGLVRVIGILPNKVLGVVADHDDLPVDSMVVQRERQWLCTLCQDEMVRFWDLAIVLDDDGDDNEEEEEHDGDSEGDSNSNEVAEDDEEEESDGDSEEEEVEEEESKDKATVKSTSSSAVTTVSAAVAVVVSAETKQQDKKQNKKKTNKDEANDNESDENSDSDDSDSGDEAEDKKKAKPVKGKARDAFTQNKKQKLQTTKQQFYADL